jgi:hypothetical protein
MGGGWGGKPWCHAPGGGGPLFIKLGGGGCSGGGGGGKPLVMFPGGA